MLSWITIHGCQHDKKAISIYAVILKNTFPLLQDFYYIPQFLLFIEASPDVVQCKCYETGVIEIRCPYSCIEKQQDESAKDKSSFGKECKWWSFVEGASKLLSSAIVKETV